MRVFIKIQKKRKNYFSVKLKLLKSIQVKNLIRRVHKIGLFKIVKEKINFNISQSFTKQFVFEKNKVEALAVINNKIVFATDDENLGSAINISIDGH